MVNTESQRLDLTFHALSDATRRGILQSLTKKERTVGELAKPYEMSLAAVSKHLKVLESANLITRKKEGSFQIVSLNAEALKRAEHWISFYRQFWDVRLDKLKRFLEGDD